MALAIRKDDLHCWDGPAWQLQYGLFFALKSRGSLTPRKHPSKGRRRSKDLALRRADFTSRFLFIDFVFQLLLFPLGTRSDIDGMDGQ